MTSDLDHVAQALPDYEVAHELGRGAFGVVYLARHRALGRSVAVKQLAGPIAVDPEQAARFQREAQILARLDHRHVVTVYDFREHGSVKLLVMELLTQGSVADLRRSGMNMESAVAMALATASGLHHVHEQGVLHRDVKPENLMLSGSGVLKVTDFGLARNDNPAASVADAGVTQAGQFLGTPAYAAPEQAAEALSPGWSPVGPAADQYALAALLYETLSGRYTHESQGGALALFVKRLNEPARPLADVAPHVPAPIAEVVMRGLEREPAARYASVEDFGVALAEAAGGAFGPGWTGRSNLQLHDVGAIGAASPRPSRSTLDSPVEPPAPAVVAPEATPPAAVGAAVDAVGAPVGAGDGPGGRPPAAGAAGNRGPGGRRTRWWYAAVAPALLVLVVAGALLASRSGAGPTAGPPGSADVQVQGADRLPLVLEPAWKVATGAPVFASPTSADGLVTVGSEDGTLYGLDAATGAQRWATRTPKPIRSTAARDGGRAYVGTDEGVVYAVDVGDGSQAWKSESLGYEVKSSPTVAAGTVLVGAGMLHALSAADGTEQWKADVADAGAAGGVISSPAVAPSAGGEVVVVGGPDGVVAVGLADGARRWKVKTGGPVLSSPRVADGTVYVGSDDGTLYAIDVNTGETRWSRPLGGQIRSSPAVEGDVVYVGNSLGELAAVDAGTGEVRWERDLGRAVDSSPLVVGDQVVVGVDDQVVAVDLATGARDGAFQTGGAVLSSPRLAGDLVVVGSNDGSVYAIRGVPAA